MQSRLRVLCFVNFIHLFVSDLYIILLITDHLLFIDIIAHANENGIQEDGNWLRLGAE
jgi:hypothetical protein